VDRLVGQLTTGRHHFGPDRPQRAGHGGSLRKEVDAAADFRTLPPAALELGRLQRAHCFDIAVTPVKRKYDTASFY
jgi:hypothetical protein